MCMIGRVVKVQTSKSVTGWRLWNVSYDGKLLPAFQYTEWTPVTTADAKPTTRNQKGLWAFKTRKAVREFKEGRHFDDGAVIGRVRLTGKIIEHEDGYRGEHATILGLVGPVKTRIVKAYKTRVIR